MHERSHAKISSWITDDVTKNVHTHACMTIPDDVISSPVNRFGYPCKWSVIAVWCVITADEIKKNSQKFCPNWSLDMIMKCVSVFPYIIVNNVNIYTKQTKNIRFNGKIESNRSWNSSRYTASSNHERNHTFIFVDTGWHESIWCTKYFKLRQSQKFGTNSIIKLNTRKW